VGIEIRNEAQSIVLQWVGISYVVDERAVDLMTWHFLRKLLMIILVVGENFCKNKFENNITIVRVAFFKITSE
jgi:hypothetical protein